MDLVSYFLKFIQNLFLAHMMEGALEAWRYYNNNQLPDRIIIYRDGVGDGQLSYIHDHELPQIQTKINEYIGHGYDHEPQLLYIVLKAGFRRHLSLI